MPVFSNPLESVAALIPPPPLTSSTEEPGHTEDGDDDWD
jgi:hypothetical protein